MSRWSDKKNIRQAILKKWEKGHILRDALQEDGLFPLRIKLIRPTTEEIGPHFAEVSAWIARLKQHDKNTLGYGYTLIEKEFHFRIYGRNIIPTHVEIPTLLDAVQLIGKQDELQVFLENADMLLREFEDLKEWICKNPFQVVLIGENGYAVLQVLRWFTQHERRDLYLRQLDIEGADTKFIEAHSGMLSQMLDIVLPQDQINANSSNFEKRYGLKSKPKLVRFRILDGGIAQHGCTDISLPVEQFQQLQLPVKRCFFTENEVNFLAFPIVPDSCVIFARGYSISLLREVLWLQDKEIFYWGDIDTHGFNILGIMRGFLPQTQSFLMSEEILLTYRRLWVKEEKQFLLDISNLTTKEYGLSRKLQTNHWGEGVRLEQERIHFWEVESFVEALK